MIENICFILLVLYFFAFTYIIMYCLLQLNLLYFYTKNGKKYKDEHKQFAEINEDLPFVTIQLPLFNELYVAERLIDNITQLDYPKDKFEIHVLDDSTDETIEICKNKIKEYQEKGFNIEHITREIRTGYKAGALKDATKFAKGEFIAIFDADFLPKKDFLLRTIPHFENPKVGVVQTRWEHINQNYSLLTRLQAIQLNVHFTVEQLGRRAAGCLLQFNGTAGVWRKQAITDAGGWESDTLTEDLDLSYRAQLKGYEIVFLERVGAPAELPAEMNGLKSQQFRWQKGGAESARKLIPTILRSDLNLLQKFHSIGHLLSSSVFLSIFFSGMISVPLMFLLPRTELDMFYFTIFQVGFLIIGMVFFVGNRRAEIEKPIWQILFKFLILFPVFLALSMGLSLHNSVAVIQGLRGKKSPFVRTPKFNIKDFADSLKRKKYLGFKLDWVIVAEGLMTIYFFFALYMGLFYGYKGFVPFHAMLALGFGSIFFFSLRDLSLK